MITLCLHNVHIGKISKSSDPVTAHSDRGVQSHWVFLTSHFLAFHISFLEFLSYSLHCAKRQRLTALQYAEEWKGGRVTVWGRKKRSLISMYLGVCKCFLISQYVLHEGVWDWGHRFSKPPVLLGRIIRRELIWYLALIGPIRVPLFRTIVAGLKLKPSSSSWLAGLITLIKHHFDRIISFFLHIHSPVCLSVCLSRILSSLTLFILLPRPRFSSPSFSTANTCQSREKNLMRVFMWWLFRGCFFQQQLHQTRFHVWLYLFVKQTLGK